MHTRTFTRVTFDGVKIDVDNTLFKECEFKNATLVYSGGNLAVFDHCKFSNANWTLAEAAGNTLQFLRSLYNSPFRPLVEEMMQFISLEYPPKDGT